MHTPGVPAAKGHVRCKHNTAQGMKGEHHVATAGRCRRMHPLMELGVTDALSKHNKDCYVVCIPVLQGHDSFSEWQGQSLL